VIFVGHHKTPLTIVLLFSEICF